MQYILMIQFTLHVLPENKPVYHQTSVTALLDACKSLTLFRLGQSKDADLLMV